MAIIMRYTGCRFGELVPAMRQSVRERRPHPSLPRKRGRVRVGAPLFQAVRAVYLTAQRAHAIMVGDVEYPYAPRGVPYSAETASSGREIGVVGAADRDAAVFLFDDRQ